MRQGGRTRKRRVQSEKQEPHTVMWGNRIFDICNFFGASFWDKSSWWIWRDQPGNDSALKLCHPGTGFTVNVPWFGVFEHLLNMYLLEMISPIFGCGFNQDIYIHLPNPAKDPWEVDDFDPDRIWLTKLWRDGMQRGSEKAMIHMVYLLHRSTICFTMV